MPQRFLYQFVHRSRSLYLHLRYLRLTLRDRPVSYQAQRATLNQTKHKLLLIQQYLEAMAEVVELQFGNRRDRVSRHHYQVLTTLIDQMQQLACSLSHLTAEYFIDPIGVQSCLEAEIDRDVLRIQQRLNQLLPSDIQLASPKNSAA